MNAERLLARMEQFPASLRACLTGLTDDEIRWKPAPEVWSILEVCCHLLDEEREDFRVRLRSTLEDPQRDWPPLDLEDAANRRGYNARDLATILDQFATERADSVRWLRSLKSPAWSLAHPHPKIGFLRAGDLLASWAAHDALHLRQIAKRLHALAARDAVGFDVRYAGD